MITDIRTSVITRLLTVLDHVYDGAVPHKEITDEYGSVGKYATLHFNSGHRTRDRLLSPARRVTVTFTAHWVAATPEQALWVADHGVPALADWVPEIPGLQCGPVTHEVSMPVVRDPDGRPPVYYGVDQFDLSVQSTTP